LTMAIAIPWSADWNALFTSLNDEYEYEVTDIEGTVPMGLCGAWWRVGSSTFEHGDSKISLVDSDGMICRFTFDGAGRVFFKNRYVMTDGLVQERKEGKLLFRGAFGTLPSDEAHLRGTKLKPAELGKALSEPVKNASNTALMYLPHQRKLISMWEGGLPHSLDPETLETLGIETFDGILNDMSVFSAHPCYEESTQRLVNFGVTQGPTAFVQIWEFDVSQPEVKLAQEHRFNLKGPGVIHDMCITPNWIIIVHNPVAMNMDAFMTKGASIDDMITGEPNPKASTRIYVLPRDPTIFGGVRGEINELFAEYRFDNGYTYHHANACEDSEGNLEIDSIVYGMKTDLDLANIQGRLDVVEKCGASKLMRYKLQRPTGAGKIGDKGSPQILPGSPDCCEMPIVRSSCQNKRQRFIYSVDIACDAHSRRPWAALMKSDTETGNRTEWHAPDHCFVGEPCFVPRSDSSEDDGWVMLFMADTATARGALLLLDARDVVAGPVCKLWLKHHVPFSTHTMWTPQPFGLPPSAKL